MAPTDAFFRRRSILLGGASFALGVAALGPGACSKPVAKPEASPSPWFITGDSIGEGLRWASGEPGLTKRGLPMSPSGPASLQVSGASRGAHTVISLGTNDAAAMRLPSTLDDATHNIIAAALRAGPASITWLGPPEPKTHWWAYAQALDDYLAKRIPALGARYVSAYTIPGLMKLHAKDGVHFGLAGYRLLWSQIRAAN